MHILPEVYKAEHNHPHMEIGEQQHAINDDEEAHKGHPHPTEKGQQDNRFSRGV